MITGFLPLTGLRPERKSKGLDRFPQVPAPPPGPYSDSPTYSSTPLGPICQQHERATIRTAVRLLSGSMPSASQLLQRIHTDGSLRRLLRADLPVNTVKLARYLVGKVIVHDVANGRLSGRIVETEAYPVGDAAGHAFRGMTPRNSSLFLERGHAYVYIAYGVSYLLNVTSERAGIGAGVLLRAVEPIDGIELMHGELRREQWADIGRGPGRLTKALQVDLRHDGLDLCSASSSLWLAETTRKAGAIGKSVRIGLTQEADRLLRFYERGNKHLSGPKRLSNVF